MIFDLQLGMLNKNVLNNFLHLALKNVKQKSFIFEIVDAQNIV